MIRQTIYCKYNVHQSHIKHQVYIYMECFTYETIIFFLALDINHINMCSQHKGKKIHVAITNIVAHQLQSVLTKKQVSFMTLWKLY